VIVAQRFRAVFILYGNVAAALGMPYPQNLETAMEVEGVIREQGAVPATIAIISGTPCIGE
jgi:pseudouridylate synthase